MQAWPYLTHQGLLMYEFCMVTMRLKSVEKFTQLFHALSDPTRLEILERLKGGEQCVCELTDALKAAQSRLSFHLKSTQGRRISSWIVGMVDGCITPLIRKRSKTWNTSSKILGAP